MGKDDMWNNLPRDLMKLVAQKLDLPGNIRLSAVSRSWKSVTSILEVPPSKCPCLLLAQDPRAADTGTDDDDDDDDSCCFDDDDSSDNEDHDYDGIHDGDEDNYKVNIEGINDDHNVINKTRGLFCLSTGKTYNIDLPQASGKVILGTSNGWLLTLGRDSEINLLHPFSKRQVTLPSMLTLAAPFLHYDCFLPERAFKDFIFKVAMSSTVPTSGGNNHPLPVVMVIYGSYRMLAFARLGDKIWTDVKTDSGCFEDVVYHKNKFYAVNNSEVHMSEIYDDDRKREPISTEIAASAAFPPDSCNATRRYLVESSSGYDLLLIIRFREGEEHYRSAYTRKYHTTKFLVWKMEQTVAEHDEWCQWIPVTNLGNESIFIGRNSSFSGSSTETIKPNCIYFTDDSEDFSSMNGRGRGHDMGIFSMEHGTIEPHFGGKSIHPFSPPLWYI